MALRKLTITGGQRPRVALRPFVSLCLLLPFLAQASLAQNVSIAAGQIGSNAATEPHSTVDETEEIDYGQLLRDVVAAGVSKVPRSLVRKLLAADVRFECSTALLRTMRAFQNFEPWVLRLMDATGKFPSGLLDSSRVDMGAFDECLETAVRDHDGNLLSRGQYCNLLVYANNSKSVEMIVSSMSEVIHPTLVSFSKHGSPPEDPLARLGICYIDDCNQQDLQAMVNAVRIPQFSLEISNCVTGEPRPWKKTQIAIVIFAAVLLIVIIISTLVDHFVGSQSERRKKHGSLFQVAKAFSVISNTRILLSVAGKDQVTQHSLQFLHGMRFLAIMHIVLGHINVIITDSYTRVLNLFNSMTQWENMLIPAAFNSVDTFFFLSGFFLCHIITKQKGNRAAVFIIAIIRRLIRMCVPLFFVIMWFYLLPRFVDGPDTENFFQRFYVEMSEHWWHFLVQIRNFFELKRTEVLVHIWYLSADTQLFLVSLLTLLFLRRRKHVAMAALAMLSLLGCGIAAWTMARLHLLPFLVIPFLQFRRMMGTISDYYIQPFYHAVCYFSGCMTSLYLADFRERKISKTVQVAGWCVSVSCGLFCVFVKFPWYSMENPASDSVEIVVAFLDRILWSASLAWITLMCSTGRGGPVNKFLSWNAFVPLSKLSYGVYLIHMPLFELMMHSSRERVYFSEFNQGTLYFGVLVWCLVFSYLSFIACDAPTAALDKLIFGRLTRGATVRSQERREQQLESGDLKTMNGGGESNEIPLR